MLQCWRRTGYLPFFSSPPGGFDSSKVPTPGNLPSKAKKNANAQGSTWRGLGAGGIDWCIILERNILHRADSLNICTPKNRKHLRLHSRTIMALDHSRLGLLTLKILANKSEGVQTNLLHFLYITSEVKQYYLSYRPQTEYGISLFFKKNSTQSIFRTINRGLWAKPFKNFRKSPIRPAGSHF